jgi:hypothetical protein
MKKIILIAISAAAISAYSLPTYEPFTEYASQIASSTLLMAVSNYSGSAAINANSSITNCIDLATGGYTAPGGEQWGALYFSGTVNTNQMSQPATNYHGLDIAVITNSSIFTSANLASLLPSTFPGFPASGQGIADVLENPAQPLLWNGSSYAVSNYVGNSAVLKFAQDIPRPASGTTNLFFSYLFSLAQKGQLGSGNEGRYLALVASSNLNEGWTGTGPVAGAAYTNYATMFNIFVGGTNCHYAAHGLLQFGSSTTTFYIGACDSSTGKDFSSSPLSNNYATPMFIVGEYVLNSGASADTNIMWMNPTTGTFGGMTPPTTSAQTNIMAYTMSDLGGLVFEDRPGQGTAGGVGTNYIANLIIGHTWSYVTGGPEFTNQPSALTVVNLGGNVSITGQATAAGQSVSYQWVIIANGQTNPVTAGNSSGATSSTLTITGFAAANAGNYQLVATASGTRYTLNSTTATLLLADPLVTASPVNATANYGGSASFTATATTAYPPLTYRWYRGTTPLSNGTQSDSSGAYGASGTASGSSPFTLTLTLTNVCYQDMGSYTLYVTNSYTPNLESSSFPATLTVNDPIITAQPTNPAVAATGTATFTVVAAGSPTLSYQWYEGATPLTDGNPTATGSGIVHNPTTANMTISGVSDSDNGTYFCAVTGSASLQTTNSATVKLTVQDALTIAASVSPASLAERVGDHLAFTISVTGGGPTIQWYGPTGSPIAGATTSALVLTNISTASAGTYSVVVSNLATTAVTKSATLSVINSTILPLATNNLVVARVGDGAQALSGATGNTIYLDQYTPTGSYVNTIQVPDEAVGSPYGTGSSTAVFGSPALIVPGAATDATNEAMLTLSGVNQQYLCFAGYCQAYPFAGADVTVGSGTYPNGDVRGLATIDAFGIYSLAYTNDGLYSGGNHTICGMTTLDGTNFWTAGQAGSGTIKFVAASSAGAGYANGSGIPGSTGVSGAGARTVQIINGALPAAGFSSVNIVCTDAGQTSAVNNGLWAAVGTPEPSSGNITFSPLLYTGGGQPADFAFSPDNNTIYVAEAGVWTGTGPGTGGIERWDTNGLGGWSYSYTLPALPGGSTAGAQGLAVNWNGIGAWNNSVFGATIYATSTGATTNSLVYVVDNGTNSTPTVLVTAGPNQALRGVRFGPAAIAPSFANALQPQSSDLGNSVTFTSVASGSAPLFYQWYFAGKAIAGATQTSFTTNNLSYASGGTYSLVASNLTGLTATNSALLTVTAGAPTITPTPLPSYTETAGDHMAWNPTVTGTLPITYLWYSNNTLVQITTNAVANGSLALTNISAAYDGTYKLVVTNSYGTATASGTLTVTAKLQNLSSNNLVVARVGDGAQPLSATNGNTLYLDQYTTAGALVNTIQIPDEGTGEPYGTGGADSAAMPLGSPALLFAGANEAPFNDAGYEAFLTLSPNGQTLAFAGYCQAYPFPGPDVSVIAGGSANWRGIGTIDAYGYYTLAYTNTGLYSAGNHQIHGAVDLDGNSTNFYTTGQAGSGNGIKYCNINFEPASGIGIAAVAGSFSGTRVVQVINLPLGQGPAVVYSDGATTTNGIYACLGLPETTYSAGLMIAEANPMDFAASSDLQTVYIADNSTFVSTSTQAGGIQRWNATGIGPSGYPTYTYQYTLGTGTGSTVGARGLTVDFSGANPILYATTAEPSGNRLIKIVDTGAASSATALAVAGPSQMLAGVRFGPVVVPPYFSTQLQDESAFAGSDATFSAGALGSGPFTYQWYFQTNGVGATNAILYATNANYSISAAGSGNVGNYYVVVKNPAGLTVQSPTVTFTLLPPPQFTSVAPVSGGGFTLNFTGPAGYPYSIWATTNVALMPVTNTWTKLGTNTFTGGGATDSYTDWNDSANPQVYYIITVP